jgi:hypothetical protein
VTFSAINEAEIGASMSGLVWRFFVACDRRAT